VSYNWENIRYSVMTRLGNPDELSSAMVDEAVESALHIISRISPIEVLGEINFQKDQATYEVEDGVIDVSELIMPQTSSPHLSLDLVNIESGQIEYHPSLVGIDTFSNPSLITVVERQWKEFNRRREFEFEFNPDTGEIRIIPAPGYNGTALYCGDKKRDLEDIPESMERPFKQLVMAESLEMMAYSLSGGAIKSVPVGIGNVQYETGDVIENAGKLRERAKKNLGVNGGGTVISG